MPELKAMFPDAPFIARPGQINAWDNEEFVEGREGDRPQAAHHRRGGDRRVRGVPGALGACEEGYEVFVVTDASGHVQQVGARRRLDADAAGRGA